MATDSSVLLNTGAPMPLVGLGTWQSGDADVEKAVDAALETGYRLIDTAYVYGNEKAIGRALKKWIDSGKLKREEIFVTTKLPQLGNRREDVEKYLKESLDNLQLDYVDLYLVHHPCGVKDLGDGNLLPTDPETGLALMDMDTDLVELWKGMEEQYESGRAKAIGVSNFNKVQVEKVLKEAKIPPAANQVELHLYLQQPELVKFCQDNKIALTSFATLGSPGVVDFNKALGLPDVTGQLPNLMGNPTVTAVAEKHEKTPAQVLLRFWTQKNVAVIPKSINPARIKQNFQVLDFTLSREEMASLEALNQGPKARIFTLLDLYKGVENHPEFPYKSELAA